MAGVDYSALARVYRWLEFFVFGSRLQEVRVALLEELLESVSSQNEPRILLVGDGDGRFLEELLSRMVNVHVDYVDCSEGMMEEANRRVDSDDRVHWFCQDLRECKGRGYDAVVAHFLLDGFEDGERVRVVELLVSKLKAGGVFLVSDFDPKVGLYGCFMVRLMQLFFRVFARLPFVEVRRTDSIVEGLGGRILSERQWGKGWIYAQLWYIS